MGNMADTKQGRPTVYTEDMGQEICQRLTEGESLRRICLDEHMPNVSTVIRWLTHMTGDVLTYNDFCVQYAKAKEEQAETYADEITHISDSVDGYDSAQIAKARLQIDTRKWVASKLKPKKYGDRIQHANDPDNPMPAAVTVPPELTDKFGEWLTQSTKQ